MTLASQSIIVIEKKDGFVPSFCLSIAMMLCEASIMRSVHCSAKKRTLCTKRSLNASASAGSAHAPSFCLSIAMMLCEASIMRFGALFREKAHFVH